MRYILLLTLLPLAATAQLKIDSIRITLESISYTTTYDDGYGHQGTSGGSESWVQTFIPTEDTTILDTLSGHYHFSSSVSWLMISFTLDSAVRSINSFSMSSLSGNPGDIGGYSESSWGFLTSSITRFGSDYRVFMQGEALDAAGFSFSSSGRERISAGIYKTFSSYSTKAYPNSIVELIFYGSVPLDVTLPERNSFTVYPNPASQIVTIAGISESEPIRIFDMAGREYKFRSSFISNEHALDISSFDNGIYFLRAGNYSQKLVVVK